MDLKDIKKIAKDHKISVKGKKKADIIRSIQMIEYDVPCFGETDQCNRKCPWREDCITEYAKPSFRII